MKLFTEYDMRKLFAMTLENAPSTETHTRMIRDRMYRHFVMDELFIRLFKKLTPIELPSDEEIWDEGDKEHYSTQHYAFIRGAKWMRDKIEGGNK